MPQLTDMVKHIIIINVLMYVCVFVLPIGNWIPENALALWFPKMEQFKPYQLVTHMFMHGSPRHLIFNMLGLFFLGPYVEKYMGPKRFLQLYFLSALGALLAHLGIQAMEYINSGGVAEFLPVVGASGALYGVIIAFAMLFPNVKLMLLFPPIPIKAKYLALGYIAYDLFFGLRGVSDGIAHFAHLGGGIAGAILVYLWYKRR